MTAEAALLLLLIKNLKAVPEWTSKVKKQTANKMLCVLMSLKLSLTIAGSRYLGFCWRWWWVSCIRLLVEGLLERWELQRGPQGEGCTVDVLELDEVPTSSVGLIQDPLGAGSQSFPWRTRKRSAQCALALQQLVIDCALRRCVR